MFVTSGQVAVDLDGSRSDFQGSAAIIIPAGTVHGFRFRPETQGFVLTVDLDRLLTLAAAGNQSLIHVLFSAPRAIGFESSDARFVAREARLLDTLLNEFRQPDSLIAPVGSWLACSAVWLLALQSNLQASNPHASNPHASNSHASNSRASNSHASNPHAPADAGGHPDLRRLREFRASIESHFLLHWPVERYARLLALSETSLNRLCRRRTGYTAFELIQQRVALEARRRLLYVSGSIAALATELGFKDAAYFCRFFRRHNGMSPGEFRRRQGGG